MEKQRKEFSVVLGIPIILLLCDCMMIAELTRIHEKQNFSHLESAFGESQMVESYNMMMQSF